MAYIVLLSVFSIVFCIEFTPTTGPEDGGTVVVLTSDLFIPTSTLDCYFGATKSLGVTFKNASSIECASPPGIGSVILSVTQDGTSFIFLDGNFVYHPALSVSEIFPLTGSDSAYHTITVTTLDAISAEDLLSCRVSDYVATGVFIDSTTFTCELPPLKNLQAISPTTTTSVSIYISRNKQDFQDTLLDFTYLTVNVLLLSDFTVSPHHGPEAGGTQVVIGFDSQAEVSDPKCQFGSISTSGSGLTSNSFVCVAPAMQSDARVGLMVSLNGIDFGKTSRMYTYDYNATITSFHPQQGSTTGNTAVELRGTGFIDYTTTLCRFGDVEVSATVAGQTRAYCNTPAFNASVQAFSFTMNGQDYYSAGDFLYREPELILSLSPAIGPQSGNTRVLVTTDQFELTLTDAYCRLGDTHKVKVEIDGTNLYCTIPSRAIVGSGTFSLWISSNDQDFESSTQFEYYTEPSLDSISPPKLSDNKITRTFTIKGSSFFDSALIRVRISDRVYTGTYVDTRTVQFTVDLWPFSPGKYLVEVSFNAQNYSPETLVVEVYSYPSVLSLEPDFNFYSTSRAIIVHGEDFVYTDEIDCIFGSQTATAAFISSTKLVCFCPTTTEPTTVDFFVNFNEDTDIVGPVTFTYTAKYTLSTVTPTSSYSREQVNVTVEFDLEITPVVVKVGDVMVDSFEQPSSTTVTFTMPVYGSGSKIFTVSTNYQSTVSGLSFSFTSECASSYYCPYTSSFTKVLCPVGHYCDAKNLALPTPCEPGTYAETEGLSSCTSCPSKHFCENYGMTAPVYCPDGFLCQTTGIPQLSKDYECSAGFYCIDNTQAVCPEGFWTGPRSRHAVSIRNTFYTPQQCKAGYLCTAGESTDQFGSSPCPSGSYCEEGLQYNCPVAHYCPVAGLSAPVPCNPGFFNSNSGLITACTACSLGFFCPGSSNEVETECSAGKVCEIEGRASPNALCPAGNYCLPGRNTSVSGDDGGPVLCSEAAYCLMGVVDDVVVDGDSTHPQTCIQGTYCETGTDSPAAEKCLPGSYCPSGVAVPVLVPPGSYSEVYGNAEPTLCAPGTYSNTTGLVTCWACPAGYYCPYDGTIDPVICPAGTYKEQDKDVIYCIPCPEGTWSDTPGLESADDCNSCDASIVCLEEGLTDISDAEPCPEGFVCSDSTTTYTLENSACPGGFWCAEGTSEPEQYGICDPAYYCPEGTGDTSKNQHRCLAGYYCPEATNATVNAGGDFEFINRTEYQFVIDARKEANEECNCEAYEIPEYEQCEEDKQIPEEVLALYTSLECPAGTTSEAGAYCVGQCTSKGFDSYVQVLNPAVGVGRVLQTSEEEFQWFVINPMDVAVLHFDFTTVNLQFLFEEHFNIYLKDFNGERIDLPDYFQTTSNLTHHKLIDLSILNYSTETYNISVGLTLQNSLFEPISDELLNTLTLEIIQPDRAQLGTDMIFYSMIWQTTLDAVELPYNLIELAGDEGEDRYPLVLGVGSNDEWFGTVYDFPPFDDAFWLTYEATTMNMPWIPFIMNCERYGDRIYLYQLLEDAERCDLKSESDTRIVEPIPVTGATPVADECQLEIQCYYAEDVNVKRAGYTYWFDFKEEATLFYLVTQPQKLLSIFDVKAGTNFDSMLTEDIKDLTDQVIEVTVVPEAGSGVPTMVEFNLKYHQVDQSVKNLVSAEIVLSQYSTEESEKSNPGYTLKVNYVAMNWLDLLNSFKLGIPTFTLIFILVSGAIVGLVMILYSIHFAFLKLKDPPAMHFRAFFFSTSIPAFLGTFYGSFPIFVVIFILNSFSERDPFVAISADWGSAEAPTTDQAILNNRGRLGMSMFFVSIYFLYYGAQLLVPLPPKPEDEEDDEGDIKGEVFPEAKYQEENDRSNRTGSEYSGLSSLKTSQPENPLHHDEDTYTGMVYKRKFFVTICIFLAVVTTFKLELSYTQLFIDNIFVFLFFFMFIDMILYQIFSRLILFEGLLVSPFLASLAINEIIMTLAADTFIKFISCYVFSFSLVIIQRLYLNPFVEYLESKVEQLVIYLMSKSDFIRKLFADTIIRNLKMQLSLLASEHQDSEDQGQRMEALLGTMVEYSAQVQANLMAPFVILFILVFADATQLTKNYGIKQNDVTYYLMFSCIILIPQLMIDIYLFHLVESLYSYKLFDYLTYCSYRFKTRMHSWKYQAEQKLDRSVLMPWRSIDAMCYSSQYYYSVTLASWGIICLSLSFTIMLRNAYNPFADPLFLVNFVVCSIARLPFRKALEVMMKLLRLWKPRSHPVFIEDSPASDDEGLVKLIDDYVVENELIYNLQTDLFRAKFVRKNKAWLIEHLEQIAEDSPCATDDLMSIYERMNKKYKDDLKVEKRELFKADVVDYIRFKRAEQKTDSERSDHPELRPPTVISPAVKAVTHEWLSQMRLMLEFKHAAQTFHVLQPECELCGATAQLIEVTDIPFTTLYERFKQELRGQFLTLRNWKRFYERHQVSHTLCSNCKEAQRLKQEEQDENVMTPLARMAKQELRLINYKFTRNVPSVARQVALKWLLECRSRLLKQETDQFSMLRTNTLASSVSHAVSDLRRGFHQ